MSVLTEGLHAGAFILREGNGDISRESGILSSGQNVIDGQLLKIVGGELVAAVGTDDSDGNSDEVIAGFVIGNWNVAADTVVPYVARLATVKLSAVKLHTTVGGGAAAATAVIQVELAKKFLITR